MSVITPEAQSIIDRMALHSWTRPHIDRDAIERAITTHLAELGLPAQPFEWHQTAREGYSAARSAARSAAWSAAWSAARSAARSAAWSAAESAAESAAWSAARSAAWSAAWSAADVNALGAFNHPTQAKLAAIWLPMVDAFNAGLWLYWITPTTVICVEQPSLHISNNRLHREDGPAVEWPTEHYWFWKGVQVPQNVIEKPDQITSESITKETNAEVRRVMIERYGYNRYIKDFGGTLVNEDATGKLWKTSERTKVGRKTVRSDEIAVVEVVNGTREPDGTFKHYFLSVPPEMKTATESVAWTYGLSVDQYKKLQVRT